MARYQNRVVILTSVRPGGIAVVEVFGSSSVAVVDKIFSGSSMQLSKWKQFRNRLFFGRIIGVDGQTIDEVIVRVVPPETSMTGLTSVEINCHGGIGSTIRMTSFLQKLGVKIVSLERYLEVAVYRKRLFRFQKEFILLASEFFSDMASGLLFRQANELLPAWVNATRRKRNITEQVQILVRNAKFTLPLVHPRQVVLFGSENAGKSTLFNALLMSDRAVTSPLPGTTRDYVVSNMLVQDMPFELIDTAGIGGRNGMLKGLSVSQTESLMKKDNICIAMSDASRALSKKEKEFFAALCKRKKKVIAVRNKVDIRVTEKDNLFWEKLVSCKCIAVSALKGTGMEQLKQAVLDAVNYKAILNFANNPAPAAFLTRHVALLSQGNVKDFIY